MQSPHGLTRTRSWLVNHTFLMGRHFARPGARQLAVCFLASTLIGVILGLAFGLFWIVVAPGATGQFGRLETAVRIVLLLVLFSTGFFVFCGIPGVTVIPLTVSMPPSAGRWVRTVVYFLGGFLAVGPGLLLIPWLLGIRVLPTRAILSLLAVDGLITAVVGAVIFSYQLMEVELQRRVDEVEARQREAAELRRSADAARFAALQAQINPHFFFNTLNSITALVPRDPDRAVDMVENLAGLFRYTLRSSTETLVLFAEELEFVEAYLDIEQTRFGARLRVAISAGAGVGDVKVPGLFLQPVVENAVRHGVSKRPEGGAVRIEAAIRGGALTVLVADDGPGFSGGDPFAGGRSLQNIKHRLGLAFGPEASCSARRDETAGETVVEIRIPAGDRSTS